MYRLRKEDISLQLYIKDVVLKPFIETSTASLVYDTDMSGDTNVYSMVPDEFPNPFAKGRGIVYFDEEFDHCLVNTTTYSGTEEQRYRVNVFDTDSVLISDDLYMVDYDDGRIITDVEINPAYVEFYWNYVAVVDEWNDVEIANTPVVVVDIHGTDKKGFQLGGGVLGGRKAQLHVFASSNAERNDITEILYNGLYLKSSPIYALEKGTVLDFDGTFYSRRHFLPKSDNLFSRSVEVGVSSMRYENVSSRNVNMPIMMSKSLTDLMADDFNSHRATITFDIEAHTEGWE